MIWVIVLIFVVVVGVFFWDVRRKAAAREAASAERMKAFVEAARGGAPGTTANSAPLKTEAPVTAPPMPVAGSTGFTARAPLLNTAQTTLFVLLKTGLPAHEILPCVSLAAFIQPSASVSGFEREAQERRLSDAVVDFLVCDKTLQAVAVVQCGARTGKAATVAAFAAGCVATAGLRWVDFAPDALPARADIAQRVLGVGAGKGI